MDANVNKLDDHAVDVREQVKDALRSLARHNVSYDELVAEGVDSYVLRSLYEELRQNSVKAKPLTPTVKTRTVFDAQKLTPQNSQPAQGISPDAANTASKQLPQAVIKNADANSDLTKITSVSEAPVIPNISESSKAFVPTTASIEKSAISPSLPDVAMERKDRIAHLLAAKTGKPLPPRLTPENQARLAAKNSDLDPPLKAAEKSLLLPEKPPLPSPESLAKTKNKAQTELIRQKMEALKKEALAKAQGQCTAAEASVAPSLATATPSGAANPQPGANRYLGEAGSNGLGAQIPGLFMTGMTPPSDSNSTNGRIQDTRAGDVSDQISMNSTVTPVSPDSSAESANDHVRSPGGHILPVRLPPKRPLASDSFDEPMPSSKRPFGQKDSYEKVEIVVSDGEVEDVEMELDEESDQEKDVHQNILPPAVPRREGDNGNLPTSIDLPSPKSTIQPTSGVGTPTSTAIQTPGREHDKEELWKAKNQEIELMRKKIAEMEERRKAKQNATRAISPKLSEKDTLPAIRTSLVRRSQPATPGAAKPPVAANAETLSGIVKTPVLAVSRPEELPSTPSTPLYAIREPCKAEDLRQQLLRRKTTREGTPSVTVVELRQAKLAEERARLAEVRREAERREAEILEESKLLEAQLQAGLNDEVPYEGQQTNQNSRTELDPDATDQKASDSPAQKYAVAQRINFEGVSELVTAGSTSPPHGLRGAAASYNSPPYAHSILIPSNEEGSTGESGTFAGPETALVPDIATVRESQEHPLGQATDQSVDTTMGLLEGKPFNAPVSFTEETEDKSSLRLKNGKVQEAYPNTLDSNLIGEDGSVSMSDSASEDYEPAEPDQVQGDLAENDSEPYEPADVPTSMEPAQASTSNQEEITQHTKAEPQPKSLIIEEPDRQILIDDAGDAEDGMLLTESGVINEPQIVQPSHGGENNGKVCIGGSRPHQPKLTLRSFRCRHRISHRTRLLEDILRTSAITTIFPRWS
jgi:hypothetical protein